MTEVGFSTYEGAEIVQPKVYIQDAGVPSVRAAEYVDFTDRLGENQGKNLLLNLAKVANKTEGRGGVSFQSTISSITWFNGNDRFWTSPFPITSGTVYGRTRPTTFQTVDGNVAYFTVSKGGTRTVLTGHKIKVSARVRLNSGNEIETDLAIFLIEGVTQSSGQQSVTMKVTSIAQPLLKHSAEVVKDGDGWYQNRNFAFLVRKILEDQYKVPDHDIGDTTAGTLPATFTVPDRILIHTDDWATEQQWQTENPGSYFTGPDSRVLSNYGRPPEWDGTRYRNDGLVTRAIGLWQTTAGSCDTGATLATLDFNFADDLLPTGQMGPRVGDSIVLRNTSGGLNDGTYEILTIPTSSRVTVTPELNVAEVSMEFTITVIVMGCDDQLWEYLPDSERYNRLTDGAADIELGDVTNGDSDIHSLDFRMLELNDGEVFAWAAYDLPRYKTDADPTNWGYDLTSKMKAGIFWRNETEGDVFHSSAEISNVHTGELLWRSLQYQFWPNYWQLAARPHYNLQAGAQLDLTDPIYSTHAELNADNRIGEDRPPAFAANRGYGIILPFAQKLWFATRSRWGQTYSTEILNHYGYIGATKKQRTAAFPGWYENNDPTDVEVRYNPDTDNSAEGNFPREEFTYPRPGTSDQFLNSHTAGAKELLRHRSTDTNYIDEDDHTFIRDLSGSVQSWSMPESTSEGALVAFEALLSQELILGRREHLDPNETGIKFSNISDTSWLFDDNRVADVGVWTVATPVISRDRNKHEDDWDANDEGSLVIPHSWGTKGCVTFVQSAAFANGLIAYPSVLTEGTGIHWKYMELEAAGVAATTSITTTSSASSPVRDAAAVVAVPSTLGSGTTNFEVPYNSKQDSFDNDEGITLPISAVGGTDGNLYVVSLHYGFDTNSDYRKSSHITDRPQCDILKLETTAAPTTAAITRLYSGSDSTNSITDADYYLPMDIYFNPDGGDKKELLLVLLSANLMGQANSYRLAVMSKSDAIHNDRGLRTHVVGTGFRNRPTALTYDDAADLWYAITAENGNLVSWPVIGDDQYQVTRLDFGSPSVRDEGFANVKKLVIDPHTRRDPTTLASNQETEAFVMNKDDDWTVDLAAKFDAQHGDAADFVGYTDVVGTGVAKGQNFTGLSSLKYTDSDLSGTEYEILFDCAVSGDVTPVLPYSTTFSMETDELFTEHPFEPLQNDATNWSIEDGGPVQGTVLQGVSSGFPYIFALYPKAGDGDIGGLLNGKPYSVSSFEVQYVQIQSMNPGFADIWFVIDRDRFGFDYVGFRLTRPTVASNWELYRECRIDGGSPTSSLEHTFAGGPTEFGVGVVFSAKITRAGAVYEFFIDDVLRDSFTQATPPSGGSVAVIVDDCTVNFDDFDIQGTATESRGGIVISDQNAAAARAVTIHPSAGVIKLWSGTNLDVLEDTFTSDLIRPLSADPNGQFTLDSGSRVRLRIRKDMHSSGLVKVFLDRFSNDIPIFEYDDTGTGSTSFGPLVENGIMLFDLLKVNEVTTSANYDPSSRSIIYGISAPTFSHEYASGDVQASGKFFLFKYDVFYSSRIELADFQGMTQWKALQELARLSDYVMGFELDDFFFVPRLLSSAVDSVFFKNEVEGSAANIISLKENDAISEVYNRVVITPGNVVLQQPSWNLTFVNRSEDDLQRLAFQGEVDHRGTRQESIRLRCVRGGKLTPDNGVNSTPQFAYLVVGKEIETFLTERRDVNTAPYVITIAESVAGLASGDEVEIPVLSGTDEEETVLRATVASAADVEDGGQITLEGAFTESADFPAAGLPIGTTVVVRTDSIWSHLTATTGVPRFWPHDEDNPDNADVALESGRFYRIGLSNVYFRINDEFYDNQVKRFTRFLNDPEGESLDEKELYLLGTKEMGDFRQGDIIELEAPGLKIDSGERFTQQRVSMASVTDYGKRAYPVSVMKFMSPRQARDLARRVIRQYAFPKPIYMLTVPFNPSISFLDGYGRLRRYEIQDPDMFPFSVGSKRIGIPRSITHNPVRHQTIIVLKDESVI